MELHARDGQRTFRLSGLWIAAIGFFVTRFTVTLAAYETRTQFLVGGVVPLVLGLLLAAFGVALLVGSFRRRFVWTVAIWCTAGTLAMAVLVGLTLFGTAGPGDGGSLRADIVLSNFLIGGALLGAMTGIYAGRDRRNRDALRQQANRLETINRILRHEVLNAIALVRGRAEMLKTQGTGSDATAEIDQILDESDRIVTTVDDVKYLARSSRDGLTAIDLGAAVEECVETLRDAYPDVEFVVEDDVAAPVEVWGDAQLPYALAPLIENAAVYDESDDPVVEVRVVRGRQVACVRIADSGPGLPSAQRATLEQGSISDFDDPTAGFGTNVARLFVEGYGGEIQTDVTDEGTTIDVELALATGVRPSPTGSRSVRSVGVDRTDLAVAGVASILAGAAMGLFIQEVAGVIPVIGALYGVADPLVGWLSHEFHSVVFGFVYAGLLLVVPSSYGERLVGRLAVAVAWSLALWLVAAGLVMPLWLNLVGIPAPIPSLSVGSFFGHLVWGVALGAIYHVGTT